MTHKKRKQDACEPAPPLLFLDQTEKENDSYWWRPLRKVQIIGQDGHHLRPIKTDHKGQLKTVSSIPFSEKVIRNLFAHYDWSRTRYFDLSRYSTVSFVVTNKYRYPVKIQLEISPDSRFYKVDIPEMIVEPHSFQILTPTRFIRYARIAYHAVFKQRPTVLDVYLQAQGKH